LSREKFTFFCVDIRCTIVYIDLMNDLVEMAMKKAQQSGCKFKISAIALDKRGDVIATAVNRPRFNREGGGVHAEMVALQKGGRKVHSMIICRVGNSGDLLPIEPCDQCKRVLDKKRVKVYSISN
jgi:cytidine deaminase